MRVTRAVILAAGYGTRMLPATKAVPKELMPLVDAPVIEYIVDEAVQSGIEHVIIVTSAGKRAVEDHFGRVHDLERLLESKGDPGRLERVRRTAQMADIVFVRQHEMGGIADAVRTAAARGMPSVSWAGHARGRHHPLRRQPHAPRARGACAGAG